MARRVLSCALTVWVLIGLFEVSAWSSPTGRPTATVTAVPAAAGTAPPGLVSLTPTRLLDTRTGLGAPKGVLGAGRSIALSVVGRGGLPSTGVGTVMVNVTVIGPSRAGYLTAYPAGVARPGVSTVSFATGQTVGNQAFVKVGSGGKITLYSTATTHVVVDVTAYYPTGAAYTPLVPTRILDTRTGLGVDNSVQAFARKVKVTGVAGVPSTGVGAVVLNVAVLSPSLPAYVTRWPFEGDESLISFMNAPRAQTSTGMTVAKIGVGGAIWLNVSQDAQVVADVLGWFPASGSDYVPGSHDARLIDTRSASSTPRGPVAAGGTLQVTVPMDAARPATAVEVSVTAVDPAAAGYLTAYPSGMARPNVSTSNYTARATRASSTTLRLPASGTLSIYTSARTNVIVDVVGYFYPPAPVGTIDGQTIRQLSAGGDHSCAVLASGAATCWGANDARQLGDGSYVDRTAPVPVLGLSRGVASVSAGYRHSCAALATGAVQCWGANDRGQLGDSTTTVRTVPVVVPNLADVSSVSAGGQHSCALVGSDAWCWGRNDQGQVGDDTLVDRLEPTPVGDLRGRVSSISAGSTHTCAVLLDGSAWCWGANGNGQLGDGGTTASDRPVQVVGLDGQGAKVASISAGYSHTCAVLDDGGVRCWGANSAQQLGDGTIGERHAPVTVTKLSEAPAASVEAGYAHSCASLRNGRVTCWGSGSEGQVGISTNTIPRTVVGVSDAVAVTTGYHHSCALLSDGIAKCWGWGVSGRVGDGTTTTRYEATTVNDLSNSTDGAP